MKLKNMNENMDRENNRLYRIPVGYWNISRVIYLVGGLFVGISAVLALAVDKKWLYFTIFVGIMFVNFSLTGYCPMAIILDKVGVKRA